MIGLSVLAVTALAAEITPSTADEGVVPVVMPNGVTIQAELADTPQKRAKGLMYRETLARDRGMLFTFAEAQPWTFWMKNTRIPLDIVWMDGKKRIIHVERNVPVCHRTDDGCPQYQPNENAMFVLELPAGMADTLKLQRGISLKFTVPAP
jgi:uncharacterized membrane protein (UPF0127 family)